MALIKVKASAEQRAEIANLVSIFRARIVDVAPDSVIVEITGTEDKIESLLELLRPIGVLEMVRTGQVAMSRGRPWVKAPPGAGVNGNGYHKFETVLELGGCKIRNRRLLWRVYYDKDVDPSWFK
jgi:acetolactate synthase-1/3 small subunit